MSSRLLANLSITTPASLGDDVELHELSRDGDSPNDRILSVVAVCRKNWRSDWPALGGTRCVPIDPAKGWDFIEREIRREAHELAFAMYLKNNFLRTSEKALSDRDVNRFGWQGAKGVVWIPLDPTLGKKQSLATFRTPARFMAHGRLVEHLGGDYVASKDAWVGARELMWIERTTSYTIGGGSKRDTGEATAEGVAEGMRAVWKYIEKKSLKGVPVMICGLGKVGLPLARILASRDGAALSFFDPALNEERDTKSHSNRLREHIAKEIALGAAVDVEGSAPSLDLLSRVPEKNFAGSDLEAMKSGAAILCCATDRVKWLLDPLDDGGTTRRRFEILTSLPAEKRPRVILGPANDQVPMGKDATERDALIAALTAAGILFVPDPAVSPGGVIAVSHELGVWKETLVNADARDIVHAGIDLLFRDAGSSVTTAQLVERFFEIAS